MRTQASRRLLARAPRLGFALSLSLGVACSKPKGPPAEALLTTASSAVTPSPGADAAPRLEDLLALTPSRVSVSSSVRNPRDFPEHLVDGDPNTAWNSKTGELVGATIAFRVPTDARVEAVELTAGYVRVKDGKDLFTMNHRIKRVDLLRNGALLRTADLDVGSRALQRLVIGTAGGEFQVVVRETVPGTEASWREVVVSELRVLGTPGKERRAPTDRLFVSVGSLDAAAPEATGTALEHLHMPAALLRPHASLEALCATFRALAPARAAAEIAEYQQWNDAAPVGAVACEEKALPPVEGASAPWTGAKGVRLAYAYTDAVFVVGVTAEGVRLTPIRFEDRYGNGMGCGPVWTRDHVDRVRFENGWLVTTIDGAGPAIYDDRQGTQQRGVAYQRGAAMCRFDGKRELSCLEWNPQYVESFAYKVIPDTAGAKDAGAHIPWEREATFRVDEKGEIARSRVR